MSAAFDLSGRVAVVTGGAGGIGRAIARTLAGAGARLVLVDRDPAVTAAAAELGRSHLGVVADVTDEARTGTAVAEIRAATGRIDILVNNAGVAKLAPAAEHTLELWDWTFAINLKGAFLWSRACGAVMLGQRSGRLIHMASQAAVVALDGHLAYCASKAGLLGLSRVLALEWGPFGITSNAILPTVVETELGRKVWAGAAGDAFKAKVPTGRFAQPEEIAAAVLYLASDAAAMVNGAELRVDGGYTAI